METDHSESDLTQIRRHAALFDTRRQAVIGTTLTGEIVYWNEAAQRLYGWAASDVLGRPILEVTPTLDAREQAASIMERLRDGRSWSGEFSVCDKSGDEFTALIRDVPVHNEAGMLIGIIGISSRR